MPLGRWAIDEAARTIAAWDSAYGGSFGVGLTVNVSAIQLQRDDIVAVVERALATHKLSGDRFTLELTESALVSEGDTIGRTMHALKDLGAKIAMDDFGTGYSNLAYLMDFTFQKLKIDRSFVARLDTDENSGAVISTIVGLSRALGVRTIAEGVETEMQATLLRAAGCESVQGYFYGRPLPLSQVARPARATGTARMVH